MRQPTRVAWGPMKPNWLNPREDRAWRAFVYANYQLVAHLNRGLQESGLSGADYAVLAVLSDLDGDRMPARDLCTALSWEKSRLSHQLRRMQKDGLISREPNPDDARSTLVCLLPAGRAAIEKAAPRHVEDVRANFINLFTPAELDTLSTLNEQVLNHLATKAPSIGGLAGGSAEITDHPDGVSDPGGAI